MTAPLTIRRLAYSDLPQVIAIERRSFPTPWSLAMFVLELSKPSGICLAALRGHHLIGYLVCSRYDQVWHLMNVAVEPAERRQGIATALVERLFEQADGPGEQYTLEVRPSNPPAIAMYERFGFERSGLRRAYYQDNKEDALIMWRTVGADGGPYRARSVAPGRGAAGGADGARSPNGDAPPDRAGDAAAHGSPDARAGA